jgi:hypothetical protein
LQTVVRQALLVFFMFNFNILGSTTRSDADVHFRSASARSDAIAHLQSTPSELDDKQRGASLGVENRRSIHQSARATALPRRPAVADHTTRRSEIIAAWVGY